MNELSHNAMILGVCACIAAVGIASVVTGHDMVELTVSLIAAIGTGAPPIMSVFEKKVPAPPSA